MILNLRYPKVLVNFSSFYIFPQYWCQKSAELSLVPYGNGQSNPFFFPPSTQPPRILIEESKLEYFSLVRGLINSLIEVEESKTNSLLCNGILGISISYAWMERIKEQEPKRLVYWSKLTCAVRFLFSMEC